MQWNDVHRRSLFDPEFLGNTTFNVNGPSYDIKGFEVQFVGPRHRRADHPGLGIVEQLGADQCALLAEQPCPTARRQPDAGRRLYHIRSTVRRTPTRTACSAPAPRSRRRSEFNIRARYDFNINEYKPFVWAGAESHRRDEQPAGELPAAGRTRRPTTLVVLHHAGVHDLRCGRRA